MANEAPANKQAQIKAELKETKVRTFGDPQQAPHKPKAKKGHGSGRKSGDSNQKRPKAGGQAKTKAKTGTDRRGPGPDKAGRPAGQKPNRKRQARPKKSYVDKTKQAPAPLADQLAPETSRPASRPSQDKREDLVQQNLPLQKDQVAKADRPLAPPAKPDQPAPSTPPSQPVETEASRKKDRRSKSWLEMTAEELRQANEDLEEEILRNIASISQIKLNS
ncbi:MAG: hypothetical protein PUG36_00785 [Clostridiales bacterium]|nr:hypothetical protein [Clostridiales bacterium]